MDTLEQILQFCLSDYKQVVMAFLFGSSFKGYHTKRSDVDIAVYLHPYHKKDIAMLWETLEKELKKDIDLVVLNEASATIAWEALKGKKLLIRDQSLYLRFLLDVSREAEDFRVLAQEIYERKEKRKMTHAKSC